MDEINEIKKPGKRTASPDRLNKPKTEERFIYSDKFKKGYFMVSGTLVAGFSAKLIASAIKKDIKPNVSLMIFIGAIIIGGYYTSKILKNE